MSGQTKAQLAEEVERHQEVVAASEALQAKLADRLSATQAELERTVHALHLAEAAADYSLAEHHPRWTKGGELLLCGDVGLFGDPEGDPATWAEGQVVNIDGPTSTVTINDGRVWQRPEWAECAELITRARLPRPEPEDGDA